MSDLSYLADTLANDICTPKIVTGGEWVPASCSGPAFYFQIDGGICEVQGEYLTCGAPSIIIYQAPATCNHK